MAKKIKSVSVIALFILISVIAKRFLSSSDLSIESLRVQMNDYGRLGPIVLTLVQMIQVVIPILPGYLGCAAGAICYGPYIGFICNYLGISAGSIIAYALAKKYGKNLVIDMFSEKKYEKWSVKIVGMKSYNVFLFVATLLPLFPDDFLCYFSGLINMDRRKFIWIILLGKPWCILAYSIVFGLIK